MQAAAVAGQVCGNIGFKWWFCPRHTSYLSGQTIDTIWHYKNTFNDTIYCWIIGKNITFRCCVVFESVCEDNNVRPITLQLQHHTQWLEEDYFNIWDDNT